MVFEEQVAYYLDKYLGKFVKGLSKEALKISVWKGDVELTNMQLKAEALNALKLPVKVKAGFLGSVKLKVPWSRLGQEPVVVYLDRIFLLAEPATSVDGGHDGDAVQEAKMQRVTEAERKLVEAKGEEAMKEERSNSSWLGSLISTIIGNLKLTVSNIHIRYEDVESHPGHPFSAGLTLEKLAAVTVDEDGKETFVTGGSLDRIQKAAELQRLAVYFDPDTPPWEAPKQWEDLRPNEWAQIFVPGIKSEEFEKPEGGRAITVKKRHSYVLQPVGGNARYYKLANKDQRSPDAPAQKADVMLDDVTVGVSEGQYRDVLKLVENFSTFNKRLEFAHYRPSVPISEDKRGWWLYAVKAVNEQQKRASGQLSWKKLVKLSELRKQYVSRYVSNLQAAKPDLVSVTDDDDIKALDRELDTDLIIQWRMIAHTYVDENRANDQRRQQQKNGGWWPFSWGGQSTEDDKEPKVTDEDLEKFNKLIGYDEGEQSNVLPGQDPPNMLHTLLRIHMRHNATKLVAHDDKDLLEIASDDLLCVLHMYPKTIRFDLKLDSYQVVCPEGLLAESADKTQAVYATFTYLPSEIEMDGGNGQKLDWSLSAKASPIYVTVLMQSINNVTKFFQSSKAVSRSVARDTATALQTTLDEVTRNAQQQINNALKDRPRFSVDLDLAAPKVTIPTEFRPDGTHACNLLVDLGYLSFQTVLDDEPGVSKEENDLFMRFRLKLMDVSAILADGEHDWKDHDDIYSKLRERKKEGKRQKYLPVLEKCGMMVAFQQICVPHPLYPSTRVALRLPSLEFNLSPARYHRLMEVTKVFQSGSDDDSDPIRPWEPSDFEGKVQVLGWKGVGHREAVWQRRHAALTGPFVYLLEAPDAQTYKYCSSLIGKQVSQVPPESVGDVPYVLAVCDAGQFNNKVAESVNALLLRFEDESSMNAWQGRLVGAIYRTSTPAAIASLVASKDEDTPPQDAIVDASQSKETLNTAEQESVFLIGLLDELKIIISDSELEDHTSKQILLEPERPLLEFRALGTKVEFSMRTYDMSVGAVLQALEIEDKCNGHVSPSCKYLARSDIKQSKISRASGMNGSPQRQEKPRRIKGPVGHARRISRDRWGGSGSESDRFFDATDDLESDSDQPREHRRAANSGSEFFDAEEAGEEEPPTFKRTDGLLPITPAGNDHQGSQDEVHRNFVKVQCIICSQDSPDYKNIDKQVIVSLATLSFFSNRRTLLALLNLVSAITAPVTPQDPNPAPSSTESDAVVSTINPKAIDDRGQGDESHAAFERNDSVVKGLLGRGKSREVFRVVMDMDRAQIFLNTEDGGQLSVLSLADLHIEVKVFPSSFGIKAGLGNLQITDGSLDSKHSYYYICNMRDPEGASFIELEFLSFNKEDDDYEGFEYSIMGKLSEVRVVYLNRFVQEITNYFMGLVPQSSDYVVKLKDRVTDVEKYINQSDIEGQPALKLALSLNKPVIIMPRSTTSKDFLELDILHINLYNNFQWLGGEKDDLGAVRLETTSLELEDLHLVVGLNGETGEGIIQEARGLGLTVRRPIRDLWHQLPAAEASIKIDELRAALSDREYQLITECAVSNMAETPHLPPPLMETAPDDKIDPEHREYDTIVPESDNKGDNSQKAEQEPSKDAWTTVKVGVAIDKVELRLFNGQSRDSPLGSIQVTGVWAAYKSNNIQESNVQATLEKFTLRDDREGTQAEMRYMVGNSDDNEVHSFERMIQEVDEMEQMERISEKQGSCGRPGCRSPLTMLVMDAKLSPTLQNISLRIQRPRLLVALDFLLAVAEFFVPSMHAMLSDGKGVGETPMDVKNALFLTGPIYSQSTREVVLSPKRPLIVDKEGIDTFIYDGRGNHIRLLDRKQADLRDFSLEVIILVGEGKKLIFKNVVIQNGDFLDSCVSMGSNSSYTASENDGVFLEGEPENKVDGDTKQSAGDGQDEDQTGNQAQSNNASAEIIFDLQAVSPELTFYDSMTKASESALLPERLMRARLNIFSRVVMKAGDMEVNAQINGLTVEAESGLQVVEPVDMTLKYTNISGGQKISLSSTEIHTNFSFSSLQLILRLQADVMSFLRITSEQTTAECSQFDKVWADDDEAQGANCITFWRPRAPPGFAVLGDCMTPKDELPSKGVIAVNMSLARVKRPVEMVRLWSSDQVDVSSESSLQEDDDNDNLNHCSVWLPVPPPGYVSLGCVAYPGKNPPPLNTCFCVLSSLVSVCGMKDCIIITGKKPPGETETRKWSFWRVDNSSGSFFLHSALEHPQKFRPHELRQVISNYDAFPVQETKPNEANRTSSESPPEASDSRRRIMPVQGLTSGRIYENVALFNLIWWDKNSGSKRGVSIWRPVVPKDKDCVILGDVAVRGYEPPSMGFVLHDVQDAGLLVKPVRFQERGQLSRRKGVQNVSFWLPVAPPGYVALGCVASTGSSPDEDGLVRCIRSDLVIGSKFSGWSLWETSDINYKKQDLSIWEVENDLYTFIVGRGVRHPPKRLALGLADLKKPEAADNLEIEAEIKQISATVCDDFGGLMAPLVDVSISGITVHVHGRVEALHATVNFSVSAMTFNGKNSSWEPLIEDWDGHVRYEYASDPSDNTRPTESRLRLTASSALNINLSTANLNMFLEAYASWNRLNRMEESSKKQFAIDSRGRTNSKSALSGKSSKTLVCINHNELGEELFLRVIESSRAEVLSFPSRGTVSVKLPSAQGMHDRTTKITRRKSPNKIVALRIGEAQVLRDDGIGGREYIASVTIIPRTQTDNQEQLQYQSARTRSAAPEDGSADETVNIHWDEVFIFEVEPRDGNMARVIVTDVSKGAALAVFTADLIEDSDNSTKLRSEKRIGGHIPMDLLELQWDSLYPINESEDVEAGTSKPYGKISLAKHFFSVTADPFKELDVGGHERGTIQVGRTEQGPWSPVGLTYALGASPWTVNDDVIATEFYVDEGVKHLVLRSLAGIQNVTDFDLEVSLCMRSVLGKSSLEEKTGSKDVSGETVEEELFENQRYQPIAGWGSKWPGHLLPTDPGRYSAKNLTNPFTEFPDVKLPLGWEWTSDWHVDKVPAGDQDGWGYAFDFRSLQWPPQNSEKLHSFVRRRRWVRSRQSVSKSGPLIKLGVLKPGSNLSLPVACLREESVNYCLQIRPTPPKHGPQYEWSQVVPYKGFRSGKKQQAGREISVRSLVETEELLSCTVDTSSNSSQAKPLWFCLEATANVIGKDEELDPVKEWKLMIIPCIMLRNFLPVPCEYSVIEKASGKRLIVRDRGLVKPGGAANIFHIDLRKAIYLTWLPKGGWNPKKETVIISHPYREAAEHISYSNTRTGRSLQVVIEHDNEEKGVATKVLKLYVPCWLDSAKCPPLRYRLMQISRQGESKKTSRSESSKAKKPYEGVKVGNITEEVNFEERDENAIMLSDIDPKTMGLSVGISTGDHVQFGPVSALHPLDNPDGYLELRGLAENGFHFRFLVSTASCPLEFAKTKVIRIRPYILFTNRIGEPLFLKQKEAEESKTLQPSDWKVSFPFPAAEDIEFLQVKLEGYDWSYPFAVEKEDSMVIPVHNTTGDWRFIKVDIRGYEDGSRFTVTFRLGSTRGPYRLENRTANCKLKYRQLGLDDHSWQLLKPHSSKIFAWENPQGEQVLEVLRANEGSPDIVQYEIDKIGDHDAVHIDYDIAQTVSVRVIELLEVKTVRFYNTVVDLEEFSEDEEIEAAAGSDAGAQSSEQNKRIEVAASSQVEVVVSIGTFGLSIIDQNPRELLYLSLDNVVVTYQIGFGERITRFKLRIGNLQLDNQLSLTWMPILLAPEGRDESKEFLMKVSLVMYDDKSGERQVYPYVGFEVESGFRIHVYEPIIWAIVEMYNSIHMDRLSQDSNVVDVDPEIRIDLIDLSEVRLKLTLETAAGARPRGMLGVWSPFVTTLGNTNKMPIRLGSVLHRDRYMRKSAVSGAIVSRISRDLIHQPLQLLSGVDVLGMTSSTLGTLSQGAAQLSKDGSYLDKRSKERSRNVAGVGDGLLQGTEALARSFGYGLSGVVTKPVSSARQNGFVGFFQGVGKAALGFVMLPVSGVLDFMSLTVNGVGITCISCFEIFDREPALTRRRLPRATRGGSVLVPYDVHSSEGQAILQLAQVKLFVGLKGVFSEPFKFAGSDFYEAHFELPRARILLLTNRRILMLGRPKSHFQNVEKTFSDPSSILWKVKWDNLLAMEITETTENEPRLILHLRKSTKSFARVVQCLNVDVEEGVSQTKQIYSRIHRLWKEYGPDRKTILLAAKRRRHQSGRLTWRPRSSKRTESSRDQEYEDRMLRASNSGSRDPASLGNFTREVVLFEQIWSSEQESSSSCCTPTRSGGLCTIWRPSASEGYVSVGDIARIGSDSPPVAITYKNYGDYFAPPLGYTLVWRNWRDGFSTPVSIWMPKAPAGYVAVGCVAVANYVEPDTDAIWCVRENLTELTTLEEKEVWHAPSGSPWHCYIFPVASESLSFVATRDPRPDSNRRYFKVKVPSTTHQT